MLNLILNIIESKFTCKVQAHFINPKGKWPEKIGNVVFADKDFFFKNLVKNINTQVITVIDSIASDLSMQVTSFPFSFYNRPDFLQKIFDNEKSLLGIKSVDLSNIGFTMAAVIKDKPALYNDFTRYKFNIVKCSNDMMRGVPNSENLVVTSSYINAFDLLFFVSVFVENIIVSVMILFAILSYFLINSLMIFNVDEKTYEFGMLRVFGFKKGNLVVLLLIQGIIFAVVGWFIGFISASLFTGFLKWYFYIDFK